MQYNEGYLSCSIGNGNSTYAYNGSEDQRGDFYPVNSLCALIPWATTINVDAMQRNGTGAAKTIDASIYILAIKVY